MKKLTLLPFFLSLLMAMPAHAAVNIFACEPEFGALATLIGGEDAKVMTATTAFQDAHQIQARPALIASVRNASMVFCSGAELEVGWLPILVRQAGNSSLQPGNPGYLMAADFVEKLEIPEKLDRSMGDIHPEGNPHIVTDPHNMLVAAKVFTDRIKQLDQAHASNYDQRYNAFNQQFSTAIKGWEQKAAPLKGLPIVIQHDEWAYLAEWLGIKVVASLEPKPGVPPTSAHLSSLLEVLKNQPAKAIILAPFEDKKAAEWLSDKTNLPIVALPYTVGGTAKATDLYSLYDSTINQLLEVKGK